MEKNNMLSARTSERGSALVIAMAAAVFVSIIVAVVMNLSIRRFELSAQRTDHEVAKMSSEAGLQYAFARLASTGAAGDAFRARVQAASPGEYTIACHLAQQGLVASATVEQDNGLHVGAKINTEVADDGTPGPLNGQYVGGKHVRIRIHFFTGVGADVAPDPARPYRVRVSTNFAEG